VKAIPDTEGTERSSKTREVFALVDEGLPMHKNIQFVTDAAGRKTGVILPIEEYEDLMDDLGMGLAARESKAESRRALEDVVKELRAADEIDV
jgi:hypothetical protein